jgi:hypothetical protein
MADKKRDYKKEYQSYHSSKEQKEKRASRNAARRKMIAKGEVKKGDGKDVIHKDGNPLNNGDKNLGKEPKSVNRSFPRKADGSKKNKRD